MIGWIVAGSASGLALATLAWHYRATLKCWIRAVKQLARDPRIPRWLRIAMLLMFVPIPGPFDEIVALLAFGIIAVCYRPPLRDALAVARNRQV